MLNWDEIQDQWESEGYHPAILSNDHYAVMQYTGLLDKNGKEIYEGDVIGWSDVFEPYKFKAKVKWWEDRWVASNEKIGMPNASLMVIPAGREIIGNIYENPELLNG